jgi:pimeloyl-ACP methyl ester carboxylesterase
VANSGVHFDERGSGRNVLMLHGNPDTCELWAPVAERLGRRFRCILPDLPGFGRSVAPVDFDASLDAMAAWVEAALGTAGATSRLDLVAHDFGAIFGMAWAIRHPERVRRIAVGGFPFFPDYRWHFWGRAWRTPLLGELSLATMNWWLFRREMKRGGPGLDEEHVRRTYEALTPVTKKMIPRLYRAADPEKFAAWQDGLQALAGTVPMMIIWGELDPYVPPRYARRFGSDTVHVLPGVGHWFPAEAPDKVAELLRHFLGAPD